jgi:outer membrane protein OmpA-like peptidoglycan-associated protein
VYVETGAGEGKLTNLGPVINTPYAEYSPYLHPDGKTLFFSSSGHYGLGGLDVFVATRQSDSSWTEWSEPVNLGKQINGPYNDWGFQITTGGDLAYYATAEKKSGCWEGDITAPGEACGPSDIFTTELPALARPAVTVTVSGMVMDPDKNPLEANIAWNDLTLNKSAGIAKSDPDSGGYLIILPAGHKYAYSAEKEGYMGASASLDFTDVTVSTDYKHDIVLYPLEKLVGEQIKVTMNNIFFDFDMYSLRPESYLELDRWVDFLTKNPDLKAEIHGHTCWLGSDEYNQKLSENRAKAVVNYLADKGVAKNRLGMKGFGESMPAASNDTKSGREMNRRVEVLLTK